MKISEEINIKEMTDVGEKVDASGGLRKDGRMVLDVIDLSSADIYTEDTKDIPLNGFLVPRNEDERKGIVALPQELADELLSLKNVA